MKFQPVIGLEIHVELNTKSKMFCGCSADYFGKKPNTHTCPVCLGLPGALPYINQKAIESCIKIGLALNCSVYENSLFERKNYFYPDLSKGFQTSQYRWPLTVNGWLEVEGDPSASSGQEKTKIRINRAHQEEDTGKLTHQGNETLIDFNRSGVPLVEIVTEPDFTDSSQIRDYAKKLQQIFRYLEVSNADMERGDMRLEANVSVREKGQSELPPYRVELKNINSFRFMVAAVEYEIKRQIEAIERGEKLNQETRGWNEDKRETYIQRTKEEAHDYRYFPEPDLPELKIESSELEVEELKKELPELPWVKAQRFENEYGIKVQDAKILTGDRLVAMRFEDLAKFGKKAAVDPKMLASYIVNQKVDILNIEPEELINTLKEKTSGIISDESLLEKVVKEVIEENPKIVEDFKKGKESAIMALVGGVMRKTQGKADAGLVRKILADLLKS